jgi:transcriptional regulator with XRE-family HTH domain
VKKNSEIANRLRDWGLKKFGTFRQFSNALGISYEHLYRYIKGGSNPGAKILSKLSELGCDINWLLTGRGRDSPQAEQLINELEQENRALRDELKQIVYAAQALEKVMKAAESKINYQAKKQ